MKMKKNIREAIMYVNLTHISETRNKISCYINMAHLINYSNVQESFIDLFHLEGNKGVPCDPAVEQRAQTHKSKFHFRGLVARKVEEPLAKVGRS